MLRDQFRAANDWGASEEFSPASVSPSFVIWLQRLVEFSVRVPASEGAAKLAVLSED
jgi:hypothetical protein